MGSWSAVGAVRGAGRKDAAARSCVLLCGLTDHGAGSAARQVPKTALQENSSDMRRLCRNIVYRDLKPENVMVDARGRFPVSCWHCS